MTCDAAVNDSQTFFICSKNLLKQLYTMWIQNVLLHFRDLGQNNINNKQHIFFRICSDLAIKNTLGRSTYFSFQVEMYTVKPLYMFEEPVETTLHNVNSELFAAFQKSRSK